MYLKNIIIENMGAIERFELLEKDLIKSDNTPKVVILVGQNGSGKTTLLSSIVDAFYEFGNKLFEEVLPKNGMGYKYFKIYGGTNLKINCQYGFNFLQFESDKKYEYIDFIGDLEVQDLKLKINSLVTLPINTNQTDSPNKLTSECQQSKEFKNDFLFNSYCYFPSDRFETPYWLNTEILIQNEQFKEVEKFSNKLDKEILIRKSLSEIKSWILDVFLDSRADIIKTIQESGETLYNTKQNLPDLDLLKKSVENINVLISEILGSNVELEVNFRGRGNSRLKLVNKITRQDVLPSLNNLSAGQSTLLSIFANIIKSSDVTDLNKSINLNEMSRLQIPPS